MTWAQKLIARLTETEDEGPTWERWEKSKSLSAPFAVAEFSGIGEASIMALYDAGMPGIGGQGHAQVQVLSAGRTIKVFTEADDAPEGCMVNRDDK